MPSNSFHRWHPIEDYEVPPDTLARAELRELAAIWQEQRQSLESADGLREFSARLHREWAIETGLLERLYTFDRGVTELLIERGLDASLIPHVPGSPHPEHVVAILHDHEEAIDGLFAFVKGERQLTTSYIREIHALLTRNQGTTPAVDQFGQAIQIPLIRGDYKQRSNNPRRVNGLVHEYCPPEHVAAEMDRLIELHQQHKGAEPEVEAAWLHHRFTQIHPFQDGNGRVARALASLVFLRAGWFPLVIRDVKEERTRYLDALEAADHGSLGELVAAFSAAQRRAFVQALGISDQVLRLHRAELVIAAAKERLESKRQELTASWERAKSTTLALQRATVERFHAVEEALKKEMGDLLPAAPFVDDEPPHDGRGHYFRWQVIQIAKQLGYYANLRDYRAWTRLVLKSDTQSEILVSFHSSGHEFRGLLAVSACLFRRNETEEGERNAVDLTALSSELFQVNYLETEERALARYYDWLEEVLVKGLELWRASL